ncbi:MAG: OsmC family peroxiredoxin [Anaerolineae bacterium]|jgi:osmotically inducible protein OsmC|nr:OsmC family peroxiredoxin [Anaerolineae bacterium]
MAVRTATATWTGTLKEGTGALDFGAQHLGYNFVSRFEGSTDTNPEELMAAAHAGCYSMALNAALERAGTPATSVVTTAKVHLTKGDAGFSISQIDLETVAEVPGIDPAKFQEMAEATKTGCIISKALSAVPMTLTATLK